MLAYVYVYFLHLRLVSDQVVLDDLTGQHSVGFGVGAVGVRP